jgi:hypothetical protein
MGRGLSNLQQDIIVMAYMNKEAGVVAYHTGPNEYNTYPVISAHVKREQILRERFGWEPSGRRGLLTYTFSKNEIGPKRYNRVMASLSRALHRLERRGFLFFTHRLLAGSWSGVELTEEGEAEARRILERRKAEESADTGELLEEERRIQHD